MESDPRNPQISLLKKYDIPIDHLSYEYVEKCCNKKELEKIVRILRSGEEGSYPDLLKVSEERLRYFAPESRILRVETPILTKESLTQEEWNAMEDELLSWEKEMRLMDKSLDFEKTRIDTVGNKDTLGVRKIVQNKPLQKEKIKATGKKKITRIASGDYAAWEKFDVDKELLKIDVEEEKKLEENERKKREAKKQQKKNKIEIVDLDKENYSAMEQQVLANQAKDRGNECYKSGDLESALKYYEISIHLYPTANAYNNRAMTYLKLKQYGNAIKDCNEVLQVEKKNIKALHRRATAYQNMPIDIENNNYAHLALQDLYEIIFLEPHNKVAQADLQKLKKKLNIEDTGKKFRMPISEEAEKKENCKELEKKKFNSKGDGILIDKLPLTYYGPSTSSFQCEPNSMMHRALSGSSIPGQVLCKCNSNRPRQNPLCQKCGEAICTPKPINSSGVSGKTKSVIKAKDQLPSKEIINVPNEQNSSSNNLSDLKNEITNNFEKLNSEGKSIKNKHLQKEVESVCLEGNTGSDKNENHNLAAENDLRANNSSAKKMLEEQVSPTEKVLLRNKAIYGSDKKEDEIISDYGIQNNVIKTTVIQKNSPTKENIKEIMSVCSNGNDININDNQNDNIHNSKKSKHRKKKSKDLKENKGARKHLEPLKIEPIKVVHASKYLQPTSVEPKKVRDKTTVKTQEETNLSSNIHFKAFVPNKKCYSSEYSRFGSTIVVRPAVNECSSSEGNKENISDCRCYINVENESREDGAKEIKRDVSDSAFEFMKAWEELKKFDESFAKRAEIIRKIRPSDLSKVIGIKLDSDMLSCLLECLLRHFVETDPKRVVELLNELPQVPRYALVSMFLTDTDKKKLKQLIETAEGKGFMLDVDVKKNLTITS